MTASSNVHAAAPQQSHATASSSGTGNGANGATSASSHRRNNSIVDGEVIGDYVLGETIGKGTFGKVRLGLHLVTGEKVAVKILEKKKIVEIADVERVSREIKILKRNRHMNIIQLFEVIDSPERIFLIMEFVDGGEMFDYIVSHRRIRENEAVAFFQQIVDGLDYLHINEVTHRDLKPENLLLQSHPRGHIIKIVDFGLSNTHDGGRLLRTACGSPCYAAPEMIEGKLYVGPLADIWSLGVILFAMVCGYLPFEDNNTSVLYKKILSADYTLPTFISSNVQDLIRKILETNPEKRYNTNMIRQHPWFNSARPPIPKMLLQREDAVAHQQVMAQIQLLGQDPNRVVEAIKNKQFNKYSATYYLLYNKFVHTVKDHKPQRILQAATPSTTHGGHEVKSSKPEQVSHPVAPLRVSGFPTSVQPEAVVASITSTTTTSNGKAPTAVLVPHTPSIDPTDRTGSGRNSRPNSMKGGRHLVICAAPGTVKVVASSNQPVPMSIPSSTGSGAISTGVSKPPFVVQSSTGGGSFKGIIPTVQPTPPSPSGRRLSDPNALREAAPRPPTNERKLVVHDAAAIGNSHGAVRLAPFTHAIVKDANHHLNRPEIPPVAVVSYPLGRPQRSNLSRRTLAFDATSTTAGNESRKQYIQQPHQPSSVAKQDDARAAAIINSKDPYQLFHELQNQAHAHGYEHPNVGSSRMTAGTVGKAMNALLQKRATAATTGRKIGATTTNGSSFTPVL